ncbi:site-specific DNA-methyltransferase, partial [bacterium]|nr:site-specific DNA-methyltransferase [bacterium]
MVPVDDTLFFPQLPVDSKPSAPVLPWQRWAGHGGMVFNRKSFELIDHLVLSDNLTLLDYLPAGIVDLVYIDPPFATGSRRESPKGEEGPNGYDDSWTDPEAFVEWLTPRLEGLWRILSDHGNLLIHLDNRAIHYVRVWCDKNFGADRLENEIIWHYTGGGRSKKRFSRKHDILLWYSKGP